MQTIAEYVENAEIQSLLSDMGADYGQGYYIHKPIPLAVLINEPPSSVSVRRRQLLGH